MFKLFNRTKQNERNMLIAENILSEMQTNSNESLMELSLQQPVLLVFLRHFGCVFCMEALDDLSKIKEKIEKTKTKLVFVHMSPNIVAEKYFTEYDWEGISHISDVDQKYYRAFGLSKASFSQLYGLQVWIKGFTAKNKVHQMERMQGLGDATQMPGIFMIHHGEVKESFIHKKIYDTPDYKKLLGCCS